MTESMIMSDADCFCSSISYFFPHILDNYLLNTLVDIAISPWLELSSTSSQEYLSSLKEEVIKYYCLQSDECMVLGVVKQGKIRTAHIWRRSKANTMYLFNLQNKIDSPRNWLRLTKSIEQEFDRLSLTIIQENSQLKVQTILNIAIDLLHSISSYQSV